MSGAPIPVLESTPAGQAEPSKIPTLILAHGAGAHCETPWLSDLSDRLATARLRVLRFNFPYMEERRRTGKKKPPDRAPKLLDCWRSVITQERALATGPLFIGGKSMGGRMASLIADEMSVQGLIVLGFPFHAPGREPGERIAHLADLQTPTLICQGTRDSMGRREEAENYALSPAIRIHWLEDGDHSFKPRKASGLTLDAHQDSAASAIRSFIQTS